MKSLITSLSLISFLSGSMAFAQNDDNTNLDLIGAIHAEILLAKTINETAMRQNRWEVRDELHRFHKHGSHWSYSCRDIVGKDYQ